MLIEDQNDPGKPAKRIDPEWIAARRPVVMYFIKKKWCVDGDDLDELTQQTMVAALQSYPNYDGRNNADPGTYLLGIANHVAQTYFRQRVRRRQRNAPMDLAETVGTLFRDEAEASDLARLLREQIARLPKKYVQVLELVFYKGYKEGEVAEELGLTPDKVYSAKSDALKRLRKLCLKDAFFKTLFL